MGSLAANFNTNLTIDTTDTESLNSNNNSNTSTPIMRYKSNGQPYKTCLKSMIPKGRPKTYKKSEKFLLKIKMKELNKLNNTPTDKKSSNKTSNKKTTDAVEAVNSLKKLNWNFAPISPKLIIKVPLFSAKVDTYPIMPRFIKASPNMSSVPLATCGMSSSLSSVSIPIAFKPIAGSVCGFNFQSIA